MEYSSALLSFSLALSRWLIVYRFILNRFLFRMFGTAQTTLGLFIMIDLGLQEIIQK